MSEPIRDTLTIAQIKEVEYAYQQEVRFMDMVERIGQFLSAKGKLTTPDNVIQTAHLLLMKVGRSEEFVDFKNWYNQNLAEI